jgi:hypothetical protein
MGKEGVVTGTDETFCFLVSLIVFLGLEVALSLGKLSGFFIGMFAPPNHGSCYIGNSVYPTTHLVQFINKLIFGLFMVLHGMLLLREAMHVRGVVGLYLVIIPE